MHRLIRATKEREKQVFRCLPYSTVSSTIRKVSNTNTVQTSDISSKSTNVPDKSAGHTHFREADLTERYASIISRIDERKSAYEKDMFSERRISAQNCQVGGKHSLSGDFVRQSLKIGHLVEIYNKEPCIIVEYPTKEDPEHHIVYDASGRLRPIPFSSIAFTLGQFIDPAILKNSVRTVKINGEECKHLIGPVQNILYSPLRKFIENSYRSLGDIGKAISNIMRTIQQPTHSVTVPFFDLARAIEIRISKKKEDISWLPKTISGSFPPPADSDSTELTASTVHIVYHALSRNFAASTLIDTDPFIVTFLPRKLMEQRNAASITKERNDVSQLIKCYGLEDISSNDSDSSASAILAIRADENFKGDIVDPGAALRLLAHSDSLNLNVGPFIDRQRFTFLKNNQLNVPADILGRPELRDRMERIRADFGDSPVYCIDSESAHEIDDGISLTVTGDIAKVSIHIADPMSAFEDLKDDVNLELLRSAYRQTATAYFPTTSMRMLPKEFTDKCGLVGKERRTLCMSFEYDLAKKKIIKNSSKISPSFVKNLISLTYDEVDEILTKPKESSEKNLHILYEISNALREQRLSDGAFALFRFSKKISVDDSGNVSFAEDIEGPAQKLVTEIMIRGNVVMAEFLQENELAGIYRTQSLNFDSEMDQLEFEHVLETYPSLTDAPYNIAFSHLRFMKPAQLGTFAGRHAGLGLSAYCHATSPLRRFQDMLLHWQAETFLLEGKESKNLIPQESMSIMARRIGAYQRLISFAQKDSVSYWTLRAIQKEMKSSDQPMRMSAITYLPFTNAEGFQRVYLPKWGIFGLLYVDPMLHTKPFKPGTEMDCMIRAIEPLTSKIILNP